MSEMVRLTPDAEVHITTRELAWLLEAAYQFGYYAVGDPRPEITVDIMTASVQMGQTDDDGPLLTLSGTTDASGDPELVQRLGLTKVTIREER